MFRELKPILRGLPFIFPFEDSISFLPNNSIFSLVITPPQSDSLSYSVSNLYSADKAFKN